MMIEIQDLDGVQEKDVLLKRTNIKKKKKKRTDTIYSVAKSSVS